MMKINVNSNNIQLMKTIHSGATVCFEGISDVENLKNYNILFNTIIQNISNSHNIECNANGIYVDCQELHIPDVWFGIAVDDNGKIIESEMITGFSESDNLIRVDVTDNKDLINKLIINKAYPKIAQICKIYKTSFIHEIQHFYDSIKRGKRNGYINNYKAELSNYLNELSSVIPTQQRLKAISNEISYHNNHTERNAFIMQYIWNCLVTVIESENTDITFEQFIKPLKTSYLYKYLLPESKKRFYKRFYYFWNMLNKYLPEMKELIKLGNVDIDQLYNNFIEHMDTKPIDNSINESVYDVMVNKEFGIKPHDILVDMINKFDKLYNKTILTFIRNNYKYKYYIRNNNFALLCKEIDTNKPIYQIIFDIDENKINITEIQTGSDFSLSVIFDMFNEFEFSYNDKQTELSPFIR